MRGASKADAAHFAGVTRRSLSAWLATERFRRAYEERMAAQAIMRGALLDIIRDPLVKDPRVRLRAIEVMTDPQRRIDLDGAATRGEIRELLTKQRERRGQEGIGNAYMRQARTRKTAGD